MVSLQGKAGRKMATTQQQQQLQKLLKNFHFFHDHSEYTECSLFWSGDDSSGMTVMSRVHAKTEWTTLAVATHLVQRCLIKVNKDNVVAFTQAFLSFQFAIKKKREEKTKCTSATKCDLYAPLRQSCYGEFQLLNSLCTRWLYILLFVFCHNPKPAKVWSGRLGIIGMHAATSSASPLIGGASERVQWPRLHWATMRFVQRRVKIDCMLCYSISVCLYSSHYP